MSDLPLLHEWLSRPHVMEWWGDPPSLHELDGEYGPAVRGESLDAHYIAFAEGAPIGYIQSYVAMASGDGWWADVTDPGLRGIDQFLANAHQLGRGFGTTMVRTFIQALLSEPGVTRVQVDPSPANARAIRCYEKAGFYPVAEVDTPDGRALLMYRDR